MVLDITLLELPGGAATVLRWLACEGDVVAQGAPLLLVLTERAEVLLPAPAAGTLAGLLPTGEQVEPGGRLGQLELQHAEGAEVTTDSLSQAPLGEDEKPERGTEAPGAPLSRRIMATPLARAIARECGVALTAVEGSGAGGRVLARDVRAQLDRQRSLTPSIGERPAGDAPRSYPLSPDTLPVATATLEFDASVALAAVASQRASFARLRLPLGLTAYVVAAAAAILPQHPLLNASWREDGIALRRRLHIAVGETGRDGAPFSWRLVRDAGDLTLRGVARALAQAREPAGATFAVVSLADGGSWQGGATPLDGTAAALSVGAPAKRAVVVGQAVAVRPVATLTVAYDARVLDHSVAAAFLVALRAGLERA
jgi:pyruvate/2-oxoglutarate dehydrogenase complex dihydrolipoamide acyltransferase (E2) component